MFSTGEILTLCSLAMVLIFNIISQWRMSSAAAHADTEQITKLSMKMEDVISGINDIKNEIRSTIDAVIVSNNLLPKDLLLKYASEEQKDQVVVDYDNMQQGRYEIIESDLLTTEDGTIKHDSMKLSAIIFHYLMK